MAAVLMSGCSLTEQKVLLSNFPLTQNHGSHDCYSIFSVEPIHSIYLRSLKKLKEYAMACLVLSEGEMSITVLCKRHRKVRSGKRQVPGKASNLHSAYRRKFYIYSLRADFQFLQKSL